jgi:hypothetical protein
MTEELELMAPCGMNCGICLGYLRDKNRCPGCHGDDAKKSPSCLRCIISHCEMLKTSESGFCFECPKYPCRRLKDLDKRYRTKYAMSMIENLGFIREHGLNAFVEKEHERWRCRKCGGVICVHRHFCFSCGEKPD